MLDTSKRAYSTDFTVHQGLITRLAQKGWGRLQQAGVVMDFADVFQEMSLIYCKAAERYDASRGFTFTAYLGQAIWHDFNKFAQRLINDQCGLGLIRVEDVGDEDMDFYETLVSGESNPEEALINSRAFTDGMKSLPATERKVVGELIRQVIVRRDDNGCVVDPEVEVKKPGKTIRKRRSELTLTEIMQSMMMTQKQAAIARERIGLVFGVDLKRA